MRKICPRFCNTGRGSRWFLLSVVWSYSTCEKAMTIRNLNCFVSQISHRPGWKTSRIECSEAAGGNASVSFECKPGTEPAIGSFLTVRIAFDTDTEQDADLAVKAQKEAVR
jgi:hypothetical protein